MYYTMAQYRPEQVVAAAKWHLLAHASDQVRTFGPLKNASTESFEKYNGVFRQGSINSNRLAPSRDIGRTLHQQMVIRHLISGGWYEEGGKYLQAGTSIQQFIKSNRLFLRLYGVEAAPRPVSGRNEF